MASVRPVAFGAQRSNTWLLLGKSQGSPLLLLAPLGCPALLLASPQRAARTPHTRSSPEGGARHCSLPREAVAMCATQTLLHLQDRSPAADPPLPCCPPSPPSSLTGTQQTPAPHLPAWFCATEAIVLKHPALCCIIDQHPVLLPSPAQRRAQHRPSPACCCRGCCHGVDWAGGVKVGLESGRAGCHGCRPAMAGQGPPKAPSGAGHAVFVGEAAPATAYRCCWHRRVGLIQTMAHVVSPGPCPRCGGWPLR